MRPEGARWPPYVMVSIVAVAVFVIGGGLVPVLDQGTRLLTAFLQSRSAAPGAAIIAGGDWDTSLPPPPAPTLSALEAMPVPKAEIVPTFAWVSAYSMLTTLRGEPVPAGATVEAFLSDGTLIGRTTVVEPGSYGIMAIYGDDLATAGREGAREGDAIFFRINDVPAEVIGPDEPLWTYDNALLQLDLVAIQEQA